jgi:NADH dehydrogenase FAD-containing subunit
LNRRIVLVGAGHAHLHSLRRASEFRRRGFELVVIAPDDFWYSGLATGVLGGSYPPSLDRIDVAALLAGSGAQLIRHRMSGVDLANRRVQIEDGPPIDFDALSLNLGSASPPLPGASCKIFSVKPVDRLIALRHALEEDFRNDPARAVSVAIAGAGVTGCEIAANIAELARAAGGSAKIVVYSGGEPLSELPPASAKALHRHLLGRGIGFRSGARIARVEGSRIDLVDGESASFDYLVNATGLAPPALARRTGLPVTDDGALVVDKRLMSAGADGVFAAGDCIAFCGTSLPRVGVYAIRQSPILFHNLMAFLDGRPLRTFVPQRKYLSIMTLGQRKGFAQRSGYWWLGRASFYLKDRIDRRFLQQHQPGAGLASPSLRATSTPSLLGRKSHRDGGETPP